MNDREFWRRLDEASSDPDPYRRTYRRMLLMDEYTAEIRRDTLRIQEETAEIRRETLRMMQENAEERRRILSGMGGRPPIKPSALRRRESLRDRPRSPRTCVPWVRCFSVAAGAR